MMSTSINESPVTYERVTGGAATATIVGKNAAMKQWKLFLQSKCFSWETITETEVCSIELFQEFATFLSYFGKDDNGVDVSFSPGTALQYLSGKIFLNL